MHSSEGRGGPDLAENGQALVAGALSLSAFAIGGVAFSLLGNPVLPFAILLALLLFALVVIMGLATQVGIPQESEDRTVDLETAVYHDDQDPSGTQSRTGLPDPQQGIA